jgi:hypothetical protein
MEQETGIKVIDRRMNGEIEPANEPTDIVLMAMQKNYDPALIEKMMDLAERNQKNVARQAYHEAMAGFKANPPKIDKDRRVSYETARGKTEYNHASLANVTEKINSAMSAHGLSASWTTSQQDKIITVTCTITHRLGHSESTSLSAAPDDSGGKNSIQAVGSTISYLERYTLLALTGMATHDMDDDGKGSDVKTITTEQVKEIETLIEQKGADQAKFLEYMRIMTLQEIQQGKEYQKAIQALKAKPDKPKTRDCPDKDGVPVAETECGKCKNRKGCPSW